MSRRLIAKICAAAIFLGVIVAAEPGSAPRPERAKRVEGPVRPAPKATVSFGPKASGATSGPASAPAMTFTVPPAASAPPAIAATLRDSLTTDTNADGQPGPGDTLTYTARITAGASALTGVGIDIPLDPNTTLVPGSLTATPAGVDDSYTTNTDTPLTRSAATGVLANDFAGLPAGTVTAFLTPTPHGGTVAVAPDGGFTYTPAAGYVGADAFTYTVANASGSDSATVSLDVRVPALAVADSYSVIKDTPLSVPAPGVLANDIGAPAPVVTPVTTATAQGGSVTVTADGAFIYTPPAGFVSPPLDSFSYTITNTGGTSSATVTLSVDVAPMVTATTPVNGTLDASAGTPANTNLTITFSEPVTVTGTWFQIVCAVTGTRTAADAVVTGGPTTFTINPNADFAAGEVCTVTVFPAGVSDQDASDPPDTLAAPYAFGFAIDRPPSVLSTSPANAASGLAIGTNVTITFSEPVTLAGSWFQIVCGTSGTRTTGNTAVTGGPVAYTIDPNADFAPGESCTATVFAAQVTDVDTNDPPDAMAVNHVFTFVMDVAPAVTTTVPAAGAVELPTNTDLTITFSEPVNVTGNWFQIVCASSGTRNVADTAVSGGSTTFTINPATDFTPGEVCTTTVFAAQVTDQDPSDPPDAMAADYVFAFTTEAAPSVQATVPVNGAAATSTQHLTITFSEPVTVTGNWFQIVCASSGTRNVSDTAVSGGPTTFTVNPNVDFTAGESCTVTVFAAQIADQDAVDPPDAMTSNHVFAFTVDAAPGVSSTLPANAATGQVTNANLTVTFSEPVDVTGNWFQIVCGTSGTRNVADTAVTGGPTTFTINPNADFAAGESCTTTIVAALVTDQDAIDPPDTLPTNYVFSFAIDAAPAVLATTPATGATGVVLSDNLTVTFSEPVTVTGNWFQIVCSVSGTRNVINTLVGGGPATFTIDPNTDFAPADACTLTVFAALVTDQDANDPPDTMSADHAVTFAMDAAPSVATTMPASGAGSITTNTDLTITFSEPVNVTGNWFQIVCASSGTRNVGDTSVSGGPTTFIVNPTDFTPGELCTVTVFAAQVADQDANDPPDNMLADHVFSFTLEQAPSVATSTPSAGAIQVATNANITITFSEPVNATSASLTLSCTTSGAHSVTASGGPTTYTFDPDTDFAPGDLCTATVIAAQVTDQDAVDPPDTMVANVVIGFSVDQAPSVTATTPANGAADRTTTTDITVTFSEPVTVNGSWFAISCAVSGSHTATVTDGTTTWTLNPDTDFTQGETCTVTIVAAQVSDLDPGDPPDTPLADYVFSFTIDAAPAVSTTGPANGATGVVLGADVTVTFSEPVNVTGETWYTIACTLSGVHTGVTSGGPTTFTINPTANFASGESCTAQVISNQIADQDGNDPPDQMVSTHVWTFATDAAPAVTTTTPANGAVSILSNANVDVTFSEPVNAAGGSFTLSCTGSGAHTFALTGGPVLFTLNPDTDFAPGETCTTTVLAAGVTDVDANDPPDNMLVNHVFTFTIEAAPFVQSSTPADTGVQGTNQNVSITFNEPVNVAGNWFAIACPSGTQNVADTVVTTTDNTTFTINPNADFLVGEGPCTVTVFAAQVNDQDTNDPPDFMLTDAVINFTIDVPPAVQVTDPANGSSNASPAQNITITFTEPVDVAGAWFAIACTISGTHTASVSGGPTTFTLDPNADFVAPETCTVTVVAAQVTDQDAGDPPDLMVADYVFSFGTDAAPSVTATTPINAAIDQAGNANVTVTFSEAVNVTPTWFQIACPTSGTRTPGNSVVTGGPTTFTINPNVDFASAETCTATIFAADVTDVDANDPPDNMAANYVFSFTIDAAPQVTTTVPVNGATNLAGNTTITITFTEPVNVAAGGVTIGCPAAVPFTPALPQGPVTSLVLTPSTPLPGGATCTVTVVAANIHDVDTNDPPDLLDGNGDGTPGDNYVFSFTVDAAPRVALPTSPANGATNQATNGNITINFTEPVDLAAGAVTLACPAAVPFNLTPALPATGATSLVIDPTSDLPSGSTCTVTVVAANVADSDTADPPDLLDGNGDGTTGDNHVFSFTTDAAPRVTIPTTPVNGATNVTPSSNITINFSELVNIAAGGITVACPVGTPIAFTPTLPQNGVSAIVLDPTTSLPGNQTCTVTVVATSVTDVDAADPPDQLDGNGDGTPGDDHVFTFTVAPEAVDDSYNVSPHLTLTIPVGTGVRANDIPTSVTITGFGNSVGTANGTVPNGTNTVTTTLGAGGVVTLNADGSFTYIPPPDIANATDHFFYTVTGGDTADVSLVIQNQTLIWFVDASYAGANGTSNGTQGRPFMLLTGAGSFDAATLPDNNTASNDVVFIKQGSYTCGLSLVNTQRIVGDGSSSDLQTIAGVTPVTGSSLPAFTGTDPVLSNSAATNCFTLGSGNTIRGVTLTPSTGDATGVAGAAFGTLTINESTINGVGRAFNLTTSGTLAVTLDRLVSTGSLTNGVTLSGVGGTLTVNNVGGASNIQGATAADVSVNGGAVSITYDGNITQGNNAPLLDVLGGHSGTIAFQTGALSATNGTGLQFNNADGTYTFNTSSGSTSLNGGDAGIDITNGSGGGFTFGRSATPASFVITKAGAGNAFTVDGTATTVTAAVTYNGNITQSNTGAIVSVTSHGTGTIMFQAGTLSAGAGTGLQFTNADGSYTFAGSTSLNGGDAGIDILTGSAGTFAFGGTTINNPTGVALNVDGSATAVTGGITISGAISKTSNGRLIDFNNYDTGTATISGALTCNTTCDGIEVTNDGSSSGTVNFSNATKTFNTGADTAINLDNNDGGTINFTGGTLVITTTSGSGFNAINGGTVTVQGSSNTINSGTGTALNITNTTIGASDVTFQSITSNGSGSANGIILDTTGSNGNLTVTGNSGSCTSAATCTGGTISNKTGSDGSTTQGTGIYLNNTSGVSLDRMQLNDFQNFAIRGTSVTGFSLTNSNISGTNGTSSAGGSREGDIGFDGLFTSASFPTAQITGSILGGTSFSDILRVFNTSGTLDRLNVSNTTFGTVGINGNDALVTAGFNNGTVMKVTVTNSTFVNAIGSLTRFNTSNNSTLDVVFRGNTLSNSNVNQASGGGALSLQTDSVSNPTVTYDISCNRVRDSIGIAILVAMNGGGGTSNGSIINNVVGVAGSVALTGSTQGSGIKFYSGGSGTHNIMIADNDVRRTNEGGIFIQNNNGSATVNASVFGNTTAEPGPFQFFGLNVDVGALGGDTSKVNVVVGSVGTGSLKNDFSTGDPGNFSDVNLSLIGNGQLNLSRNGSAGGGAAAVIDDNNLNPGTTNTGVSGTVTLVSTVPTTPPPVATCTPPLLLGEGGVETDAANCIAVLPDTVTTALSQRQLDSIVPAAIGRWSAAGVTPQQLVTLRGIRFEVSDLRAGHLGDADSDRIRIDRTAEGREWFVDPDPLSDASFPHSTSATRRYTDPWQAAAGRVDLLTAVAHEMGHRLELNNSYNVGDRDNLMYGYLTVGERRLPAHGQALGVAPTNTDRSDASVRHVEIGSAPVELTAETVGVTVGTVPAGKSIVITYQATINANPITGPGFALSTQGTVSGTNFATIVTDDPDTSDVDDATLTAMACPTIAIAPADVSQVAFGTSLTPVTFTATGGIGTTTLALSGTLPGGVTFTEASATLSGTPTETGSFPFTITATDQNGCAGTKEYTLLVGGGRIVTIGSDVLTPPQVRRVTSGDGQPVPGPTASFVPAGFSNGVRVAEADITGDGVADILTASGPGVAGRVVIVNGVTGGVVSTTDVGDPSDLSGLFVAAGDVDGDGQPDIVTGAGAGDPMVRVFSGASGAPIWSASVFGATFRGGVRVAAGDVDGDGFADIIAASGFGDPSLVKVFSGASHAELRAFSPYGGFAGGVFVAAGDVNGDGFADVITGAGEGGGPHVRVFDGRTGADGLQFFAAAASFSGGIRVASGDVNGDRRADIITAQGAGGDGLVRIFNGATGAPIVTPPLPSTAVAGALFVSTAVPANRMVVDAPAAGAIVPPQFRISGWAFEEDAPGVGVDLVDVWAGPVAGGAAIYLGPATLGDLRSDVGAIFGARYAASGYHLDVTGLADGTYDVVAFARSSATGLFNARRLVRVRVLSPGSDVRLTVDVPHAGTVRRTFRVAGSAFDAGALGGGSGVDAVHVWSQRLPGGAPTYLGAAVLGDPYPSTGTPIGYHLDVIGMAPGDYVLVVFARSSARTEFTAAQTVNVTVGASAPSLEMAVDIPAPGPVPAGGFAVGGWALGLDGASVPGVDAVHVWAFPVAGGSPVFVGAATLGGFRPDVGALFGAGYETSGFILGGATLPSGTWDLVVFARATGAASFGITRTVRITVP